jgi:hypothetical protein
MTSKPFKSDKELINFARLFFRDRVRSFRKDVAICLTADANRDHAEFPALITCIGFLDLLSGLYAGRLEGHSLDELKSYAAKFMDARNYDPVHMRVLYLVFRHKLAHLSFPYLVFDTATRKDFVGQKHRRITWTVYAGKRSTPIELEDFATPIFFKKSVRPWPVSYNCRVVISVRTFQIDIVKSIYGPTGYLHHLQSDLTARENFAKCMKVYFRRSKCSSSSSALSWFGSCEALSSSAGLIDLILPAS